MRGRRWAVGAGLAALAATALAPQGATPFLTAGATTPATCAGAAPGGEWRSYGHDLSNTRTQDQERSLGPVKAATLAPVWAFGSTSHGGSGDFTGTPVVADGCLFAGSNAGWVFALNADTGALVWETQVTTTGGVSSSVSVQDGRVYLGIADVGAPAAAALDETTGRLLWRTQVDNQTGADEFGSPSVVDEDVTDALGNVTVRPIVMLGISGGSAELSPDAERFPFQGAFVLLDGSTGAILHKTYTIHSPATTDDFAGATVWSTPAIDVAHRLAYVGTGNPFKQQAQSPHADALLKVDVDVTSPTFGDILSSYSGVTDTYVALHKLPCKPIPGNPPPYYPQGLGSCTQIDLDFGASPNLFTDSKGHLLVGAGQKAGVYHAVDTATMRKVWDEVVGPPSSVGGIVGSTAYAGGNVYGPVTVGGYLWSLSAAKGTPRWATPVGDGAHWGNPVAYADGVVYSVDLKGFLDAYDAANGAPLLHRPMILQSGASEPVLSWGGVSVARDTVYAAIGTSAIGNGYIIAFRPGAVAGPGVPAVPQPEGVQIKGKNTDVIAGPEAQFAGYATREMVVTRSGGATFYNFDIVQHNVVSTQGLFSTPLIGLDQHATIVGIANLKVGKSYSFYCTIHPQMKGTLYVAS